MQVTSERSDNVKHPNNIKDAKEFVADTVTHKTHTEETARAILVAQENIVNSLDELTSYVSDTRTEIFDKSSSDAFYLTELRKSVDYLAKVQCALVTLSCFVCLCLFALVIVLSLAFL